MNGNEPERNFSTLLEADTMRTWGNDTTETWEDKPWSPPIQVQIGWFSICRNIAKTSRSVPIATSKFLQNDTWGIYTLFFTEKQWLGHLLLLVGGIAPLLGLGYCISDSNKIRLGRLFDAKVISCGETSGIPQNSTFEGIESIFVLDKTWGMFSFSSAKTIDVTWNILVGRGVQVLVWWITYTVFSDALLSVIERHPISFRIFQRIALDGPTFLSLWTLGGALWTVGSKRTKSLFGFMFLATVYLLCVPMFLSAMTGYDSTKIPWIDPDNNNNIIPTSEMTSGSLFIGNGSERFDKPICINSTELLPLSGISRTQRQECDCQMKNGSIFRAPGSITTEYSWSMFNLENCNYDYPGATGTFEIFTSDSKTTYPCNTTPTVRLDGKDYQYNSGSLNRTYAQCYGNIGWPQENLRGKTRCLPDTAHPSYAWGFSTTLSGIFLIIHCVWSVGMYFIWQNVQFTSKLVKNGYKMTPLRAALALAKAAKQAMGLGEKQLIMTETKDLDNILYGHKSNKGTSIDHSMFINTAEDGEVGSTKESTRSPPSTRVGNESQQSMVDPRVLNHEH